MNDVRIGENAVSSFIFSLRSAQAKMDDDDWARWLVNYGYTPESLREESLRLLVGIEVLRQFARDNGVSVDDSAIDAELNRSHEELGSEAAWADFLVQSSMGEAEARINVESNLISEAVGEKIAPEVRASDDAVLRIVAARNPEYADADSLTALPDEVVADCRASADAAERVEVVGSAIAEYRSQCLIEISEDMPSGLPYDVDISPYLNPEAGEAIPDVGFKLHHVADEDAEAVDAEQRDRALENAAVQFGNACSRNADAIGWLCVPGILGVPIFQHPDDDSFYLTHNSDGVESKMGAVYIEKANSPEFDDPMTMIYGHAYSDLDVVLSPLHDLEDGDVFDRTQEFYVLTRDKVLTYRVVSAYEFPSYHILWMLDQLSLSERQQYYDFIADPDAEAVTKLTHPGFHLDVADDRVVQISTCTIPSSAEGRYLVAGVLAGERER